jgi:ubiquitin
MRRILEDMQKPIKPRHLETKTRGGAELTFIPWYRAVRYVEHYTNGHWSKEVVDVSTTDRRIFVTVRVTIHGRDGTLSRMATGTEKLYKVEDGQAREIAYGDPSSNAESMAFRRACANFGLGLDLYEA